MYPYVSRILLVAVTIALMVSALALWQPWEARRSIDLEYVRAKSSSKCGQHPGSFFSSSSSASPLLFSSKISEA